MKVNELNKCQILEEYMCMYLVSPWIHVYESRKQVVSQIVFECK